MLASLLLGLVTFQSLESNVVFVSKDKKLTLSISKRTGRFDLVWGKTAAVLQSSGHAILASGVKDRTDTRATHQIKSEQTAEAIVVTVRHLTPGKPELKHTFWLYHRNAEVAVRLDLIDVKGQSSNQLIPVVTTAPVKLLSRGSLQALFVPYDNDSYVRYSSQAWTGETAETGSYEVGALYDDTTRAGLVVGSIDHDHWKSAVKFSKGGGLQLTAGVTSRFTHDTQPHGAVTGKEVRSPRFTLGLYADWRQGLERYGELSAKVVPPLKWSGKVPFGWNSWSGHKSKLQASDADAAIEFVRDELPHLRNDGTAYINLDSYYDNLSTDQLKAFVKKAHDSGLKAGIYWSPFVNWGEPDWKTVGNFHFRDLQLKGASGDFLPKHDGAWPLDPTHPGTLLRIDRQIKEYAENGFDFVKLDFLTHGALEGKHHNPAVQTGTAAYNFGMKQLLKSINQHTRGRPFYVSLSIAPLFPNGYGHSRRVSCDVFANIGSTEYLLNSHNYGWWSAGRLYQFNDPDHACVYRAESEDATTEAEARSRLTASVIGGGLILQGDNLTNDQAKVRVKKVFSNAILNLAKTSPEFRPAYGNIGSVGGETFVYHQSATVCYVALFNFDKVHSKLLKEPAARLGLTGTWTGHDLWTNTSITVSNILSHNLAPMDCALFKLSKQN
ncbi:Alpha galactosidase, C-terminal beta sandwich domain containing protein [Fimbriimonadaceae bacterium]